MSEKHFKIKKIYMVFFYMLEGGEGHRTYGKFHMFNGFYFWKLPLHSAKQRSYIHRWNISFQGLIVHIFSGVNILYLISQSKVYLYGVLVSNLSRISHFQHGSELLLSINKPIFLMSNYYFFEGNEVWTDLIRMNAKKLWKRLVCSF